MRITKTIVIVAIMAAALIALIVWSFMPDALRVDTVAVQKGQFQSILSEEGKTRLRSRYTLSAPFTGTLLRPRLKAGDKVNQGDVVAIFYSVPSAPNDARTQAELQERIGIAEANIEEATLLYESAKIQSSEASREYERVQSLVQSGSATQQQLDRAETTKNIAERNQIASERRRHAAEHVLEQARQLAKSYGSTERSDQFNLTAPISGTILKVHRESETIVASGEPILDIGDLQELEIVSDILTPDAIAIEPGQKVLIENWGGEVPLDGRVRRVEPTALTKVSALGIEEQRTPLVIDILSPQSLWDRLGENFGVTVKIVINEINDALMVPANAVFHVKDGDYVFVAKDGKAFLRQIEIAQRNSTQAVIKTGLQLGDMVVSYPPRDLVDGARIVTE